MAMQYVVLTGLWVTFFLVHSVFASLKVKDYILSNTGLQARSYRLIYAISSVVHLLVIILYAATTQAAYILPQGPRVQSVGLILASVGVVIVMRAFRSYDGKAFFGLADLSNENMFRKDGLLRYVRHPLYAGSIVLLAGFFLYIPTLANAISVMLMILYFIVGIHFEEKKLIKHFGEDYKDYRKETPMLVPRLFGNKSR